MGSQAKAKADPEEDPLVGPVWDLTLEMEVGKDPNLEVITSWPPGPQTEIQLTLLATEDRFLMEVTLPENDPLVGPVWDLTPETEAGKDPNLEVVTS